VVVVVYGVRYNKAVGFTARSSVSNNLLQGSIMCRHEPHLRLHAFSRGRTQVRSGFSDFNLRRDVPFFLLRKTMFSKVNVVKG
jgi:hypothetical protein